MRFAILTRLLFPQQTLQYDDALARAHDAQRLVEQAAKEFGIECVELAGDWYGVDPIHILRREQPKAWSAITRPWWRRVGADDGARVDREVGETQQARLRRCPYSMRPECWTWAGEPRRTEQPTVLDDGSELWLF